MYDARNNLSNQVVADVRQFMGSKVYDTDHPAQRAHLGSAVLRQAGAGLRSQMRRQRSLSAARDRNHPARERIERRVKRRVSCVRQIGSDRQRIRKGTSVARSSGAAMADRLAIGTRPCRADRRRRRGNRQSPTAARKPRRVPIEILRRQSAQSAPQLLRRRTRRTCRFDPRARHHPADRRARAARATISRSSPASGAGARRSAPACTTCRSSIVEVSDAKSLELAIIENVQRADLNPLEEASGYQALMDDFNRTARTRSRRSSARAGRMSRTRFDCSSCPSP